MLDIWYMYTGKSKWSAQALEFLVHHLDFRKTKNTDHAIKMPTGHNLKSEKYT